MTAGGSDRPTGTEPAQWGPLPQSHRLIVVRRSQELTAATRILVRNHPESDLRIPLIVVESEPFFYGAERLLARAEAVIGVPLAFVRCLRSTVAPRGDQVDNVTVAEILDDTVPRGWCLISAADAEGALPTGSPARDALDLASRWLRSTPATRVAWGHLGWFARASAWLLSMLASAGLECTGPPVQIRAWERSCVMVIPTATGSVYLKCAPEMFAHEPALTAYLARKATGAVPEVIASGYEPGVGHYLLMRDYGGTSLLAQPNVRHWEAAVAHYAQLQIMLQGHIRDLGCLGVPRRRTGDLVTRTQVMLADRVALQTGQADLSDAEILALCGLLPSIGEAQRTLAESIVAASIEHGDLWSGQIILSGDKFLFTDWSDSAVADPFLGMAFFCDDAEAVLSGETGVYNRIRCAYLEVWADHAPRPRLDALFDAAELAGPLENALRYYEFILPRMELRWEMEQMFMFHLRLLLRVARRRGFCR